MKHLIFLLIVLILPCVSAAHYIVGEVYDATDLTSANGKTVVLWNPLVGINDNITDIIGQTGNSGIDNVYFVDCEMLSSPCNLDDNISAKVFDQGDGYSTSIVNTTITGAGYDISPNLTLTLQINFMNLSLDDAYNDELNEIDLIPATTRMASCEGIVYGPNMDALINNVTSAIFSNESSYYTETNQNNRHYTNSSCILNKTFGNSEEVYFNCTYSLQYYALPRNWSCVVNATKSITTTKISYTGAYVNSLLALELPDAIDYGVGGVGLVSNEKTVSVINAGNVAMNLSIRAYATTVNDNLSMNCPDGIAKNISLNNQRYNVTTSNPGFMNNVTFVSKYLNLSANPVINNFNLGPRQNDITNDATKPTYWRVYIPEGISGNCTGNIMFGAVNSPGI